jgi:hypothetical protein
MHARASGGQGNASPHHEIRQSIDTDNVAGADRERLRHGVVVSAKE